MYVHSLISTEYGDEALITKPSCVLTATPYTDAPHCYYYPPHYYPSLRSISFKNNNFCTNITHFPFYKKSLPIILFSAFLCVRLAGMCCDVTLFFRRCSFFFLFFFKECIFMAFACVTINAFSSSSTFFLCISVRSYMRQKKQDTKHTTHVVIVFQWLQTHMHACIFLSTCLWCAFSCLFFNSLWRTAPVLSAPCVMFVLCFCVCVVVFILPFPIFSPSRLLVSQLKV